MLHCFQQKVHHIAYFMTAFKVRFSLALHFQQGNHEKMQLYSDPVMSQISFVIIPMDHQSLSEVSLMISVF